MSPSTRLIFFAGLAAALAGCGPDEPPQKQTDRFAGLDLSIRTTEHRGDDDLLTAGLGLEGLTGAAPEPADAAAPTPEELRRMAVHAAWNGIYSLTPAGGLGGLLHDLPAVPGREFHAFDRVRDAVHPVRVMLQLPDDFDTERPCLVVSPASGSRGIYGAMALAAPWALPAGCAVAYTDKGGGTDFFDFSDDTGVTLSGRRAARSEHKLGFEPGAAESESDAVGLPHFHSGDHPEADWGHHVRRAAEFGLNVLGKELERPLSPADVQVIAAGLSNGGGAVLRATELDEGGLFDAVVAVAPNVTPPGARPLYDYATLAALFQPCLLADLDVAMEQPLGYPALAADGRLRCASLVRAGMLPEANAAQARERLRREGFEDEALGQSAVNVALGLWRSISASYASAYLRSGPFDMPCGYSISTAGATVAQRQTWWATHSGVAPGGGINLVDGMTARQDSEFAGLLCLRKLWEDDNETSESLRAAVEETRATAELPDVPVLVIHGREDGLIPAAFSSRPYVDQARASGARIAYWEVERAQHFDVLLGAPGVAGRYVPLVPYGWAGLDRVRAVLAGGMQLGGDRRISPDPAPGGQSLRGGDLNLDD